MITINAINLYNKYGGDRDSLAKMGSNAEKELLTTTEWSTLDHILNDLELINNQPISPDYINQTITKITTNCDRESAQLLLSKIEFYSDFQEIANLLKEIKSFISPTTSTGWTEFNEPDDLIRNIDQDIERIEHCDFSKLDEVNTKFLPTSVYDELALSNEWGDTYIELATKFENIKERIYERNKTKNNSSMKGERAK